jgi:hypothetical protein
MLPQDAQKCRIFHPPDPAALRRTSYPKYERSELSIF